MPIQAACPACRTALPLPDDQPGRTIQCQRCGTGLVTATGGQLTIQPRTFPGQAANPFAEDPTVVYQGAGFGPPGYMPFPVLTREMVLAKVRGPALILQITGGLCILAGLALPLLLLLKDVQDDQFAFTLLIILAPIALASGAFIVFCGLRMKALRSYGLVLTSVILLMVAGFLVCPLIALPGVWPFIVLVDPGVRASFGAKAPI